MATGEFDTPGGKARARQLLKQANAALRRGASREEVFERLSEVTGGRFSNTAELARFATDIGEEPSAAMLRRGRAAAPAPSPQGGLLGLRGQDERLPEGLQTPGAAERSATDDFLRSMAQGATFGFADEIAGLAAGVVPGGQTMAEATAASRQRIEDLRETSPTATLLGEIAGVAPLALVGAGPAASFVRAGPTGLARAGRAIGVGTGAGAAEGALQGAGEAEGGLVERARGAAKGGIFGGLFGGLLGGAGAALAGVPRRLAQFGAELLPQPGGLARRATREIVGRTGLNVNALRGRFQRLAAQAPEGMAPVVADIDHNFPVIQRALAEATREAPAELAGPAARRTAARADSPAIRQAKRAAFAPIEGNLIDDPRTLRLLRQGDDLRDITRNVAGPEVLRGERAPTVREFQTIRQTLRKRLQRLQQSPADFERLSAQLDELNIAAEQGVPGFRQANRIFREVVEFEEAVEETKRVLTSGKIVPSNLISPEAQRGGLLGVLGKIIDTFRDMKELQEEGARPVLRILLGGEEGLDELDRLLGPSALERFTEASARGGQAFPLAGGLLSGQAAGRQAAQPDPLIDF